MIPAHASVRHLKATGFLFVFCLVWAAAVHTQEKATTVRFKVIAFYTGTSDLAHVSFVREANRWFPDAARAHNFSYESTTDWTYTLCGVSRALPGGVVPRYAAG